MYIYIYTDLVLADRYFIVTSLHSVSNKPTATDYAISDVSTLGHLKNLIYKYNSLIHLISTR